MQPVAKPSEFYFPRNKNGEIIKPDTPVRTTLADIYSLMEWYAKYRLDRAGKG
jgi:hypothetical protein